MENLKIRVYNKAQSKEAQKLLFELGYGFEGNTVKETQEFEYTGVFYLFAYGSDCDLTYSTDSELFNSKLLHKEITLPELRAMVNQDQDEPFLTPETTLNDQYAEIEQVRQAKSAQASGGVDATLKERQSTYGNFEDVAFVTENIMGVLGKVRGAKGLSELPSTHRMALYMIASKMARIVNGDFNHLDSWHDIGGYAKLVEDLIKENNNG